MTQQVQPRGWQTQFLAQHAAHAPKDFLLVATPGVAQTRPA